MCRCCESRPAYISGNTCMKCGKPLDSELEFCADCSRKEHSFERGFALFAYDDVMRRSVAGFKYHGRREYADYYAEELLKRFRGEFSRIGFEAVVPVPVHRNRLAKRGYNQAALIAQGVADGLGLPCLEDFLIRNSDTLPQKELTSGERYANLRKAFGINRHHPAWNRYFERILLVDDIYTTGSTADACSDALLTAGIGSVYVLSLCIGGNM